MSSFKWQYNDKHVRKISKNDGKVVVENDKRDEKEKSTKNDE